MLHVCFEEVMGSNLYFASFYFIYLDFDDQVNTAFLFFFFQKITPSISYKILQMSYVQIPVGM